MYYSTSDREHAIHCTLEWFRNLSKKNLKFNLNSNSNYHVTLKLYLEIKIQRKKKKKKKRLHRRASYSLGLEMSNNEH
jgi:hypothetical protein